jgi:hypothetical protein
LSAKHDVSEAVVLAANSSSHACYQGQTHGHEGFLLDPDAAHQMIDKNPENQAVLFPYLTGDDLLTTSPPRPERYVIDFHPKDVIASAAFKEPFARVQSMVLPTREKAAEEERRRNQEVLAENPKAKTNRHHENFLKRWWLLSYPRGEMIAILDKMPRFIVCAQVTKRPVFEFVSTTIRPNAALIVFPLADDYSFGVLQSNAHWEWFRARCSTLKGDFRYTSNTVFDTFPWPQSPTTKQIQEVAKAAVALRNLRRTYIAEQQMTLRNLYRLLDEPGTNPLRSAQERLDQSVRSAYGMSPSVEPLAFLLTSNLELGQKEKDRQPIIGPGLPAFAASTPGLLSDDCVQPGGLNKAM